MDLTKEESSFASRMMRKMGWSEGRGLGKNEDGNVNIIRVSKKNNTKGVGFTGNELDWVAHQDDFDGLLSALQDQHNVKDTAKEVTGKNGMNLEQKSKQSRSRVHYHKAIKGKDLSKANAEDMNSILGLKKRKRKLDTPTEENDESNLKTSTTNMKDYFSNKMKRKKVENVNDNVDATLEPEPKNTEPVLKDEPVTKNNLQEENNPAFYKNLNFLNIVSHNLRTVKYRSLATKMPEFCKSLSEMYENDVFPGSNFLYIKGYGNW